ncbi:MAG: SulP family inorganic anion transporter [Candidatus Obscuribacterales bacterium]|nr:SulP family inorganic anion transporter [Candidatus Obscuribacterales bacterium]
MTSDASIRPDSSAKSAAGPKMFFPWTPDSIGRDFLASVVVFLVALPLCMGIAIASGMPPQAGIITGVIGGLVVAPLSGCSLQISGPAAGLAVIVFELLREHGPEKLCFIIMLAGLVQLTAGFSRLAQWFRAVPPSVVHGMLSGIGILIFASQFHVMVDDKPKGTGIDNLLSIPLAVWKGIVPSDECHHLAASLGILTIVVFMLFDKFKRGPIKHMPGSLLAITIAAMVAYHYKLPINYVQLPASLFGSLQVANFAETLPKCLSWEILFDGLAVAFVAAAETLLTATAVDKMHKGERTNYDRELIAQGVGNLTCGFAGGLPMTGVMVRSGVNVAAGGRTRLSGFLHGLWLLLLVACLPFVVNLIPTSTLAALLVFTGWKLANFKIISEIKKFGTSEVAIYAATVVTIIAVDLLTGVLFGVALSIAKLLYIFSRLDTRVADDADRNRTDIYLRGAATFLSLPRFADALESVRPDTELHVHLEALDYIDHACLELMISWEEQHVAGGGRLVIDWGKMESCYQDRRKSTRQSREREFRRTTLERSGDVSGGPLSELNPETVATQASPQLVEHSSSATSGELEGENGSKPESSKVAVDDEFDNRNRES